MPYDKALHHESNRRIKNKFLLDERISVRLSVGFPYKTIFAIGVGEAFFVLLSECHRLGCSAVFIAVSQEASSEKIVTE